MAGLFGAVTSPSSEQDVTTVAGGTSGSVPYFDAGGSLTEDNANFSYAGGTLSVADAHFTNTSRFDGVANYYATNVYQSGSSLKLNDNVSTLWGTSGDASVSYRTTQTPDALVMGLGSQSNGLIVCELADINFDFGHDQEDNPTLFIHSAAQSTTEWGSLAHDGTSFVIGSGAGGIQFDKAAGSNITTLTASVGLVAVDASLSNVFTLTMEGNNTLSNPTNLIAGRTYIFLVVQDGSGSHTLSYGTVYDFPGGTEPVLTTAANAVDVLTGVYDGTNILISSTLDHKA